MYHGVTISKVVFCVFDVAFLFKVGYKRFDEPTLSFGLGCSIVLGLLASLGVWFRRYLTSAGRVDPRVSRFSVMIGRAAMSAPASGLERVSEAYSEESDGQEAGFNSAHDGTAFSSACDSDALANQKNMEDLMDSMETEEMPEPVRCHRVDFCFRGGPLVCN